MNSGNYLAVIKQSYLNYENLHPPAVLTVTIRATDHPPEGTGSPLDVINDIKIKVIDVNEAPDDIRLIPENVTVPENVSIGYCLAQVTSSNPERLQTVSYTLLNYRDTFSIEDKCSDNSSGVSQGGSNSPYLTVKSHLSYDDYIIRGYQILIKAEDNGIPPASFNGTVKVHVTKVDPCAWSSCPVHTTCSRVDWQNFTCPCNAGFNQTDNCSEIDECRSNPCSHGGTCNDYVNYYNCTCPSGYDNGTDCTFINYCLSNPCLHDSDCNPILNGYICYCAIGYTGVNCETNINDCDPCVEGRCTDGVPSFTCICEPGFFGPLCQRKSGECTAETCEEQEICIPSNLEKYNSTQCVSNDMVVSLQFPEGENITSPQWQYRFEEFFRGITLPLSEITNDEYDDTSVNVNDVYIVSPSLEHESKAKRSTRDETTVDFIVLVYSDERNQYLGVPEKTVLCGINNTCLFSGYTNGVPTDFYYRLCKTTADKVEYRSFSSCVAKEAKDAPLKNQRHSTSMRLYYVIGGIGGLLLIVIITGLLLCRRNSLSERKRKVIAQDRHREKEDSFADTMLRHHMANQTTEDEAGTLNPIYGDTEEEVGPQINMLDNPIYQEPETGKVTVKRSESARGFEKLMYSSFKPANQDELDVVEDKDEELAAEPIGYANPMFTSYRQVRIKILIM